MSVVRLQGDDDSTPEKADSFTRSEDDLLIAQACPYESDFKHRERTVQLKFWQNVRDLFAEHGYEPRGPTQLKSLHDSPYYKRWSHIRASYDKVFKIVTRSGSRIPGSQQALDRALEQAKQMQRKKVGMKKLSLGFRHFQVIFRETEGWTRASAIDGGVEALSSDEDVQSTSLGDFQPVNNSERDDDDHEGAEVEGLGDVAPTFLDESVLAASPHQTSNSSRKRAAEVAIVDLVERTARRTRQAQDIALRTGRRFGVVAERAAAMTNTLLETTRALNSNAYKAQVLAQLASSIATAPSQAIRDKLELAFQIVSAELNAGGGP